MVLTKGSKSVFILALCVCVCVDAHPSPLSLAPPPCPSPSRSLIAPLSLFLLVSVSLFVSLSLFSFLCLSAFYCLRRCDVWLHGAHLLWDALCDADNQGNLCLECLKNSCGSKGGRDVDDCCVGVSLALGLLNRAKDREPEVLGSSLLGGHATNHLGAILDGSLAVESALRLG